MSNYATLENPYSYNLPASEQMFFGRQNDVDIMVNSLQATNRTSYALIAGKRMGKTSQLMALQRRLDQAQGPLFPFVLRLDVRSLDCTSSSDFLQKIANDVRDLLLMHRIRTSSKEEINLEKFKELLDFWSGVVWGRKRRSFRLVLLLDECDYFANQGWDLDLYHDLADLLLMEDGFLAVVMAGSHEWYDRIRTAGSPLFPLLQDHCLGVLDAQATYDLVTKPVSLHLSEEVVQAVIDESGGHPFLTQYLMFHLWKDGPQNASKASVKQLATDFALNQPDFEKWSKALGDKNTWPAVYRYLCESELPQSIEQIRTALVSVSSEAPSILQALCYHGLVVKVEKVSVETRYRIAGKMFRMWFEWHSWNVTYDGSPTPSPLSSHKNCQSLCKRLVTEKRRLMKIQEEESKFRNNPLSSVDITILIEDTRNEIVELEKQLDTDCPGWKCE